MIVIKRWLFRLLILVVFLVVLLAASDNSEAVALAFLDYQTPEWPLSWWVLSAFVLGVMFGLLLSMVGTTRLKLDKRRAEKAVARSNRDLDRLKATPASD